MEQLFYLLIPLGLCLFYLGIKYTIRFGRAKMLYEMPYVNKEGTFTLERAGTYGLWLSGKMFTKAPIGEFGFNLVDEKREGQFLYSYLLCAPELMALLTLEWNYIPLMRGQVPIDCLLQKIPLY